MTASVPRVEIPGHYLHCLPQSVAKESNVIPFDLRRGMLVLLMDISRRSAEQTWEDVEKLQFVLSSTLLFLHADAKVIRDAIDRQYSD